VRPAMLLAHEATTTPLLGVLPASSLISGQFFRWKNH